MPEPEEIETSDVDDEGLLGKIGGLGQKIIGEIETLGGVLTGDPTTRAEGEFNVEVGEIREEIEEEIEPNEEKDEHPAGGSW